MRTIVATAIRRRVTVVMAAVAVAAFGWVGFSRLPLELFPDVSYPSLTIQTDFPDTAPQEVENLVTRPVEEAVGVLRGLRSIHSVSRPGVSEVTLEFAWDTDMDLMAMEVREQLDRLVLPEDAVDPIVLRYDPSLDPVMRVALSGPGDLAAMRRFAERRLKPDLETVRGVAAAELRGGLEAEVHVDVDQERLAALGIPLSRVRDVVGASNVNLPGGLLRGRHDQFIIRTTGEFRTVDEIGSLIVSPAGRPPVRLRDVARVTMGTKERDEIARVDGRECVEIAVYKQGDANAVTTSRQVRARLDAWRRKLAPGQRLDVLFDQAHFIEQSIREVRSAALVGGLLAVLVLAAFLRDLRSTLIIATSIPLSVVATFMLMYRLDVSLNIMSLGGLTLGIGMLVDSSIVVLEAIHRRRREGLPMARAALAGTSEVGAAVTASTLTTVAVFLPIVFVEGVAGQLFRDQAMTVTVSLLASLVVAVTLIPMLSALGVPVRRADLEGEDPPPGAEGASQTLGRLSRAYDRLVRAAVARRGVTLAIAFALFALAVLGARGLGTELVPPLTEGEFFIEVSMPEGTALAATDRVVSRIERAALADPAVARCYATVGTRLVSGGVAVNDHGEHLGQVNVALRDRTDDRIEAAVMDRLRDSLATIPDLDARFGRPAYFSLQTPVEVVVYGDDLDALRAYSLDLARTLAGVPGLVDVRSSLEAGNPELQVTFDRERLAALGLDMRTLSQALRDRIQGAVPTRFKDEDRQIDVRVRNARSFRRRVADIENLVIPGRDGRPLRLMAVADVRPDRGPAEIHRVQQQRAAVITANLAGRSLGEVERDIRGRIAALPPPAGMTVEIGGQSREMHVSFASLRFALLLAVFLVYLVMAATFESFVHPFIVLFTVPLAAVGVVAALLATRTPVSVIVLIGTIMLVGIVVNNAIVLIDAVNRLRRAGVPREEAVVRAGHLRLRPILMTTATTVLGLAPMALSFGEGAELRAPLAITVAGGLVVGTLLTLVVIPAAYVVVPSRVIVESPARDASAPRGRPGKVTP